ncbi:hypothetical protein GCQ56_15445 [Marinifilum sp. N1E240]|uniref:hypothetical protein n=1 Tax=Marinifilum sp. N1E240 TaxID=2608082 RepID=UPI00128B5DD8|nr:hypothetical protein [Marinifilum sp. N1E240]MPQ48398.1 hypothetical protein [Marinifilum sp. N1E240]
MGLFKKEEAQSVEIKGHSLKCSVCGETLFYKREAQLNTAVASFFNLDWANRSATCFVCANCTHISWFLGE